MNDQSPCYMAFLLRLWCVTDEDGVVWRASLEDAHTGERRGFAELQSLFAFLVEHTDSAARDADSATVEGRCDSP
jgi:hypothetical protein